MWSCEMRTILVTGGAGFIGSNFIRYMRRAHPDYRIVNLDRLTYAGNLENLRDLEGDDGYTFVKGDIADRRCVERVFEDHSIDVVVNLAAESHVDRSILGPEEFVRTNVLGTFVLLEVARSFWLEKGRGRNPLFLHVSTDEVYGSLGEEGYFTEDSPYDPRSPYSASKASSDHLVRAYHHTYGLPAVITNCSNNFGPYQFPEKLIPLVIINALLDRPIPVYGDGRNVRDWIYVKDHCRAIDAVIHRGRPGESYNIGARNEWRNIDLVRLICRVVEKRLSLPQGSKEGLIRFVKDRPGHDRRYAMDPSKIERELGWSPVHPFEEAMEMTVDWYMGNRGWWERIISGEYRDYYRRWYGERGVAG